MPYAIEYTPRAIDNLRAFSARDRRIVADAVDVQLSQRPMIPTRNRKPMRENPLAQWELRVGEFRIYFVLEEEPEPKALITAVGIKDRDVVRIGGEVANP
jgi:mRNA-degrading endonuclease RelE of RelBE toxin-antitoxin system